MNKSVQIEINALNLLTDELKEQLKKALTKPSSSTAEEVSGIAEEQEHEKEEQGQEKEKEKETNQLAEEQLVEKEPPVEMEIAQIASREENVSPSFDLV